MVNDTSRDAPRAMPTVIANGRSSSPLIPPTRASGTKTATVVRVDAVTAPATSLTEATMASGVSSGPVSRRLMFSITTMESSTTRPTATVRAASVKMFSEKSPIHNPIIATSRDRGIDSAVMIVERNESRKTRMINTANVRPSAPSVARSLIDSSMEGAWVKTVRIEVFCPTLCDSPGSRASMEWEIDTASASASFKMLRLSAGRLSERAIEVASTDFTFTSARVPSLTGPSGAGIGQSATCWAAVGVVPTSIASSRFLS